MPRVTAPHTASTRAAIDGEFVWGKGKLRAVQEWADDNDVDLEASWAYSDSWYDIPLLSAVDHPVAVNPDPRLHAFAMLRRWPVQYLDVPPGVPKFLGIEPQQAIFPFARAQFVPYARIEIEDVDHIPAEGPAIICGNHRSYFDPLAIGYAVAKRGRPVRFLGKKEVFDAPIVGDMARAMGGIRVERGTGSDEPLKEAAAALEAGELVVILPQGTIPRGEAFFDPVLKGRWGAARLAEMTHAPIVPLGLWGTEKVWPRSERLPRMLNITHPPRVLVRLGEAIELKGADPDEDTARIMEADRRTAAARGTGTPRAHAGRARADHAVEPQARRGRVSRSRRGASPRYRLTVTSLGKLASPWTPFVQRTPISARGQAFWRARMMLRAPPARNHSICSSFIVWLHSKSIVEPSGFVMRAATGVSGARSARPMIEIRSSSSIWS